MDLGAISGELLAGLAGGLLMALGGALLRRFGRRMIWPVFGVSVVASLLLGAMGVQARSNDYTLMGALVLLGGLAGCAIIWLHQPER